MKHILLFSLTCLFCISCNNANKENANTAWLGGKIINPKKDFVLISQSRKVIDTIYLDKNNFFMYQLDPVESGIYFFSHNEYQAIHIEPGDSIMLRVNTREFDESLSYTGVGADKNNLMMDFFLQNEKESPSLPSWYMLPPEEFEKKIDSLMAMKQDMVNEFIANRDPSDDFIKVAQASVKYYIYAKKELYIAANARKAIYNEHMVIPPSFYNFRQNVDLGNEYLRRYYPYYRYLSFYLDNLAFQKYSGEDTYDRNSFVHNYHKILLIDSLISNDSLKNSLLRTSANRYFLHAKNEDNERKMLDHVLGLSSNNDDHKEIKELANATIKLTPGHKVPNVMLLTSENTVKDLHSILKNQTVLYFWSGKSISHYKNIHTRANELKAKYPEFDFIGINLDNHFRKWQKTIKNSGYDVLAEFQFENFSEAEMKLVIDSVNKAMVLDKDGTILNGNTNIFDFDIEAQLLGSLNK